jgi:predicted nucleotidyltransferase
MDPATDVRIRDRLDQLAEARAVTILYACESGSRAWGFPSADSDYDVRFIYVHPRDWYLSVDLERRDDTIDRPVADAIDLQGWDLRKALHLFSGTNPTLLDWLQSPLVYREHEAVLERWRSLIPIYYATGAAGPAYRGMARSVAEQNLTGAPIAPKAYLYVLRALLAVRWIVQDRGPVPVEFDRLLHAAHLATDLQSAIEALLDRARAGREDDAGSRLPTIHAFITDELERQAALRFPTPTPRPVEPLNALFRTALARASSPP